MSNPLTTLEDRPRCPSMPYVSLRDVPDTDRLRGRSVPDPDKIYLAGSIYTADAGALARVLSILNTPSANEESAHFINVSSQDEKLLLTNLQQHLGLTVVDIADARTKGGILTNLPRSFTAGTEGGPTAATWNLVRAVGCQSMLLGEAWPHPRRSLHYAARAQEWNIAFQTLVGLTRLPANWDGRGAIPVDPATAQAAEALLMPLSRGVPAPSFMPGPNGDAWAIWGEAGLSIEICFRGPDDIFAMIDDTWNEVEDFEDVDPGLAVTARVLERLRHRADAGD